MLCHRSTLYNFLIEKLRTYVITERTVRCLIFLTAFDALSICHFQHSDLDVDCCIASLEVGVTITAMFPIHRHIQALCMSCHSLTTIGAV